MWDRLFQRLCMTRNCAARWQLIDLHRSPHAHAEDTLFQRFGKEFPKGTVLFREGEPGKEMFVLQAGRVVITKTVRDEQKMLAVLGPGEFFGEMALISNKPRNATATVDRGGAAAGDRPQDVRGDDPRATRRSPCG